MQAQQHPHQPNDVWPYAVAGLLIGVGCFFVITPPESHFSLPSWLGLVMLMSAIGLAGYPRYGRKAWLWPALLYMMVGASLLVAVYALEGATKRLGMHADLSYFVAEFEPREWHNEAMWVTLLWPLTAPALALRAIGMCAVISVVLGGHLAARLILGTRRLLSQGWAAIQLMVRAMWQGVAALILPLWLALCTFTARMARQLRSAMRALADRVTGFIATIWQAITGVLLGIGRWVTVRVLAVWRPVYSLLASLWQAVTAALRALKASIRQMADHVVRLMRAAVAWLGASMRRWIVAPLEHAWAVIAPIAAAMIATVRTLVHTYWRRFAALMAAIRHQIWHWSHVVWQWFRGQISDAVQWAKEEVALPLRHLMQSLWAWLRARWQIVAPLLVHLWLELRASTAYLIASVLRAVRAAWASIAAAVAIGWGWLVAGVRACWHMLTAPLLALWRWGRSLAQQTVQWVMRKLHLCWLWCMTPIWRLLRFVGGQLRRAWQWIVILIRGWMDRGMAAVRFVWAQARNAASSVWRRVVVVAIWIWNTSKRAFSRLWQEAVSAWCWLLARFHDLYTLIEPYLRAARVWVVESAQEMRAALSETMRAIWHTSVQSVKEIRTWVAQHIGSHAQRP